MSEQIVYRLELRAANMGRGEPQFADTLAAAKRHKKRLAEAGYVVTIFRVGEGGQLSHV